MRTPTIEEMQGVAGANLTRDEARIRAELLTVAHYDIAVDVTRGESTFGSTSTVEFVAEPGTSTFIDFTAPTVTSIVLNGRALDPEQVFDGHRVQLDGLQRDNVLTIEGEGAYSRTGEGLHRFVDPVDDEVYLYTQFESADAKRMFACFDQPDLKATYSLTVTAPDHWSVVSNAPTPEAQPLGEGVAVWTFDETARMSTYITALVAGPYHQVTDTYEGPHGTYPMGVFCRASLAEHLDADDIITTTKQGFAFFEEQFDTPYAFGKYDQLFVPEFNAGAMENAGCVTFHEDLVFRSKVTDAAYEQRSNTILHELAHMWFGNLVTMRWWDDLWLNESFAEWAAHYANVNASRYSEAWTTFCNLRKAWAYRQDQLPSTHPIAADMVDLESVRVNFDGITYAKGASALRQLVAWVGEEEFLTGVRAYFDKHAWGNTELPDLLDELATASGRDLSDWTHEWLETAGVNTLTPEFTLDDQGRYTAFSIVQSPPQSPAGLDPILRSHRIAVGLYDDVDGVLTRVERIELDVTGAATHVPELVGRPQPPLLLLNDDDLTFAKIRLDERSAQTASSRLGDVDDSLARALLWGASWDMVRDAELATTDYVALVLSGVPHEPGIGVVQQSLRQVKATIDQYAAPSHRAGLLSTLASSLDTWMREAEPASDRQLAFVRSFTSAAEHDQHLDVVASLYDGSLTLPGLALDADLRWAFLLRLAASGRASATDVDAELTRDDTATGRRHAATVRAAMPTAEAKAAAWAAMTQDDALPNAMLGATIIGFMQPDQVELLTPYVEQYFTLAQDVWEVRTTETAQDLLMGLYPVYVIDEATVAAADRFLAAGRLAPVERLVGEGRDSTLRALRARACDAAVTDS
jgi:aminopeptidase N